MRAWQCAGGVQFAGMETPSSASASVNAPRSAAAPASPLRWGILATGRIAGVFASGLKAARAGKLVAVGSRSAESARRFAAEHGIQAANTHGTYEALLADPEVDAVYVSTPHPQHVEWVVKAAEAGKHILCEKPLGLNHPEGMVMVTAARRAGVVLMEAFMYRCHPQTDKIVSLIESGALGAVGLVQATFSFRSDYNATSRIWANAAGGGGILDVGGYAVSMARRVAGAAAGRAFLDPVEVSGAGVLHPESGVDSYAAATLKFANGVIAQVACGVALNQENVVRIHGSAGWLLVPSPWVINRDGGVSKLILHRAGAAAPEEIMIEAAPLYALEADAFAAAVRSGGRDVPAMSTEDTLGNLATLDRWRQAIGLTYEAEKPPVATVPPGTNVATLAGRPLARRASAAAMPLGRLPGVDKPAARLVMGCDNQYTWPHAQAMFDDYFEQGGNFFDTAHLYGNGRMERLLGHWLRARGLRDQCVVLGKGGHTPFCTPEGLKAQLTDSLDRLQTDHVDVYCLHRDNLAVPVADFVEALNAEVRAGRVRIFGGSNWSTARVAEANSYAAARGLQGFGVLSNQFSLARMVTPPWGGCCSAGDPESRAWLTERQFPLLAWSSQARGFFTERAGPELRGDEELVRCWYAPDNFERRARLLELAREKGVPPPALAAAYVLHQPFPTFALIGPRTLAESESSRHCLGVSLSAGELAWLNLESAERTG